MEVDHILTVMNDHGCRYLLIGGLNFGLRHLPILTYDIDLWIEDTEENRRAFEAALARLDAEWGPTDDTWGPVNQLPSGWLETQSVYCLNTPHGAVDIHRRVKGLDDWQASCQNASVEHTKDGTQYRGLSDEDMLRCQLTLAAGEQKPDRIRHLRESLQKRNSSDD